MTFKIFQQGNGLIEIVLSEKYKGLLILQIESEYKRISKKLFSH